MRLSERTFRSLTVYTYQLWIVFWTGRWGRCTEPTHTLHFVRWAREKEKDAYFRCWIMLLGCLSILSSTIFYYLPFHIFSAESYRLFLNAVHSLGSQKIIDWFIWSATQVIPPVAYVILVCGVFFGPCRARPLRQSMLIDTDDGVVDSDDSDRSYTTIIG